MTSGRCAAEPRRGVGGGLRRGPHHRAAARRVHVDHPRAGRDRRGDRARDGVRDVVKLRSRKTRSPRSASARTIAGPSAVKSCLPILNRRPLPRSCVGQRARRAAESTSSATRIRFTRALPVRGDVSICADEVGDARDSWRRR